MLMCSEEFKKKNLDADIFDGFYLSLIEAWLLWFLMEWRSARLWGLFMRKCLWGLLFLGRTDRP